MRPDLSAPTSNDRTRSDIAVYVWPLTDSPGEVLLNTAAGPFVNFSLWVNKIIQTELGATISFGGYDLPSTPVANQVISIIDGSTSVVIFNGIVESSRTIVQRGSFREITLVVRRRDATPFWRDTKRVSKAYDIGVDLGVMARDVLSNSSAEFASPGQSSTTILTNGQYDIPDLALPVSQHSSQLSDLSLWHMLETIFAPAIREPFVDGRGFFKTISRDIRRQPTYVLTDDSAIISVNFTVGKSPITVFRVKFIDQLQTKTVQLKRSFGKFTIKPDNDPVDPFYFSPDRQQRANDVELAVTKMSGGAYTPGYIIQQINEYSFIYYIIDGDGGVFGIVGGNRQDLVNVEVFATPYDYVHLMQIVEAYDTNAPDWVYKMEEFSSNFIPNEDVARSIAVAELFYRAKSVNTAQIVMRDDYRYEPGDIIQLVSGQLFYIQTYSRDLTRGASADITLTGFFV